MQAEWMRNRNHQDTDRHGKHQAIAVALLLIGMIISVNLFLFEKAPESIMPSNYWAERYCEVVRGY